MHFYDLVTDRDFVSAIQTGSILMAAQFALQYEINAFPMHAKPFITGYTKQGVNFGDLRAT
jgi:hypothetical protein